ncbi:MAG: MmcQ/YjbR family DNA-binding protein [Polyangiaceae bacterium]|jgi:hypothetical protein
MPEAARSVAEAALERVSTIALGFPGAEVKLSHGAPSFHVRGKMFVVFVDDHHGDGRLAVWCKAAHADQKKLVAGDPERYFVPPYVGVKGWVGVRLDHPRTDWIELSILVEEGWQSVAPKRIAADAMPRPAAPLRLPRTDVKVAREALARLTKICVALPEAIVERAGAHATFSVRKKAFAHFLDNHHGDEAVGVCVRVPKRQNAKLAKGDPERFYLPAYIASKGWVAMRLDRGRVKWADVAERVASSYAAVAPKRPRAGADGAGTIARPGSERRRCTN